MKVPKAPASQHDGHLDLLLHLGEDDLDARIGGTLGHRVLPKRRWLVGTPRARLDGLGMMIPDRATATVARATANERAETGRRLGRMP